MASSSVRLRSVTFPALMSKRKFTKRTVATPDLDPAALAQRKLHERLRERSNRALLKRRRQKSGQ